MTTKWEAGIFETTMIVSKRLSQQEKEPAMIRLAVAILTLLILPGSIGAQETSTAQQRMHEVVRGETLWDLSGRYLGNPFRWPLIAEANRSTVRDPDLIFPGQKLVIPSLEEGGADAGEARLAQVRDVAVLPRGEVPAPNAASAGGMGAAADRPGAGSIPPCPSPDERTVFYAGGEGDRGCPVSPPRPEERTTFYQPTAQPSGTSVTMAGPEVDPRSRGPEPATWLPLGLVYSAEWLGPWGEEAPAVGVLSGFAETIGDRTPGDDRAMLYERLRLRSLGGPQLRVGDLLQSFRAVRKDEDLGVIYAPTGVLTVVSGDDEGAVARISAEFDRVRLGDRLRRVPEYTSQPGARPIAVQSNVTAEVLGFAEDRPVHGYMARLFLGVGESEGIAPGDEFAAFASPTGEASGREVARLQILLVGEDVSTAQIVSVNEPVLNKGDVVLLVSKMQ